MKRSLLDLVKAEDVSGRIALVRIDANVPTEGERITDDTRLRESVPTLRLLCTSGAKILLCRCANGGDAKCARSARSSLLVPLERC